MPSQAAIEIASIFDDVISKNLKYCCVCLRTEEERKLVDPDHFLRCLKIMNAQVPVMTTICYVCESESTRAFALFQAINFATIINKWFKDMSSKLKYKDEMPACLDRHISKQKRCVGKWPLPEWWRRVRARSDLVQTEVLVVSGDEDRHGRHDHNDHQVPDDEPDASDGVNPPSPEHITFAKNIPTMDNIVIIDDDEDPLAPPPPSTPTIVPIQRLDTDIAVLSNDTLLIQKNMNYYIQPLVMSFDGNYHLVTNNDQVVVSNNIIDNDCKVLEVSPLASFDGNVQVTDVHTVTDDVVVTGGGEKEGVEKEVAAQEGVAKRAVMSGRIDWEDKIPMDVISFVDASDPTIQPQPRGSHRKKHKSDTIDLC